MRFWVVFAASCTAPCVRSLSLSICDTHTYKCALIRGRQNGAKPSGMVAAMVAMWVTLQTKATRRLHRWRPFWMQHTFFLVWVMGWRRWRRRRNRFGAERRTNRPHTSFLTVALSTRDIRVCGCFLVECFILEERRGNQIVCVCVHTKLSGRRFEKSIPIVNGRKRAAHCGRVYRVQESFAWKSKLLN